MKRLFLVLFVAVLAFGVFSAAAQDAPSGTWLGTWPYVLPPDHHLNGFAANGPNTNLGVLYRPLVELTPAFYMWATDEYMPILAESWGFTEDGAAFEMTLKAGATWSNGDPINADDVVNTYALGQIMGWSQFTYISGVEKVDELTTRFIFSGEPSLLAKHLILKEHIVASAVYGELAAKALDVIGSGAVSGDDAWTAMRAEITEFRPDEYIASGPYTYTLADVGDAFMTLRWQPNSLYSDSVKFGELRLWAGETEATAPLVLSGELAHSTNVYPPATIESFETAGIRLVTIPRSYGPAVLFNHDVYPFNIKEVRQAMAYVIDRDESAFLTNGLGAAATVYMAGLLDGSVPTLLSQDVIDQLNRYEFNPEKAEELMIAAGFSRNSDGKWADSDGKTISAEYKFPAEFADFSAAAQNATSQLNEFGFDIVARALPWQESAAAIRAGDFALSVWSWGSPSPFASRQFFGPVQRFNYVALADGQRGMNFPMEFEYNGKMVNLDEMINNASAGLDPEVQQQIAGEVALIINDLMPFIPLNEILSVEPFNENLIGGTLSDDDPILLNPSGGDHFAIYYILTGVLEPVN